MKLKSLTIILASTSLLIQLDGCSSIKELFNSKPVAYQNTPQINPLEVPPDLSVPTLDTHYDVNANGKPGSATYSDYAANEAKAAKAAAEQTAASASQPVHDNGATTPNVLPQPVNSVHLERDGCERWLVVAQPPEKIWPVLTHFWQENGYKLVQDDPKLGVQLTEWKDDQDKLPQDIIHRTLGGVLSGLYSSGQRDQFRVRIERDPTNPALTDIYLTERTVVQVYDNSIDGLHTQWQPGPADPGAEAIMLTRLMQNFGLARPQALAQLKSTAPSGLAHIAHLNDGTLVLRDDEPFDRAWRRVGLAIDRIGYGVDNSDRNKGIYTITEGSAGISKQPTSSLWDKLAFWNHMGNNVTEYQLELDENPSATGTDVRILDGKGGPASKDVTERIVHKLYDQLK